MKENDIRPDELVTKQQECLKQDIEWLLTHKHEFEVVTCPACNSNKRRAKFNKNGIEYFDCLDCETFYVSPRPPLDVIHNFYRQSKNYEFWNNYIFPASEDKRREKIFKPRVEKVIEFCKKYNLNNNSIIEIGSGFGTFCEEMKSRNYFNEVVAVEPTPSLAESCRKRGIKTIELPVEKITVKNKYDVLVSFEVIEHLHSPSNFVNDIRKLLTDSGVVILSCPNGKGFEIEQLREKSSSVDHEHLNYFNPNSLKTLLEKSGFEILETQTPGKLDAELVRKKIVAGEISIEQDSYLNKVLIGEWESLGGEFQKFLAKTNQSSHMVIVAKKVD